MAYQALRFYCFFFVMLHFSNSLKSRYLFAGEDSGDVKFQIGNETLDDFVKWALDGRFGISWSIAITAINMPVELGARQYEKDVEVPSHNTLENVVSAKEECKHKLQILT